MNHQMVLIQVKVRSNNTLMNLASTTASQIFGDIVFGKSLQTNILRQNYQTKHTDRIFRHTKIHKSRNIESMRMYKNYIDVRW